MNYSDLHFHCSFRLVAADSVLDPWSVLTKSVRQWIENAPYPSPPVINNAFFGSWFFAGGIWRAPGNSFNLITTARMLGHGSEHCPDYWAARYEHNCETPGRIWKTEIGVTRVSDRIFDFSIETSHYLRTGFIGRQPASPLPNSPRLVGWLLLSDYWSGYAGSEKLSSAARVLKRGEGVIFKERLLDPKREVPIVLVSRDFHTGQPLIESSRLGQLLCGAASVYESESTDLDKELESCLGAKFSSWNGMVRVYLPKVGLENVSDARRHRYFRGREIVEMGQDIVLEALVLGVARRANLLGAKHVRTIDDVTGLEREARFLELKTQAKKEDQTEWVKALEQRDAEVQAKLNDEEQKVRALQEALSEAKEHAAKSEFDKKVINARFGTFSADAKKVQQQAQVALSLDKLPTSIAEAAELIIKIHPNRIAFTDQALKSMSDCEMQNVGEAWKGIWMMATKLYDLFFSKAPERDLEKAFYQESGFRLAMTEGGQTKDDNKLMRLREDVFEGAQINISPHVKFDKDSTRAYFCPLKSASHNLIVVGFVGHLDTAGTRRRKN